LPSGRECRASRGSPKHDRKRAPVRHASAPRDVGVRALHLAIAGPGRLLETRNRTGQRRDWLRGDGFEGGLRRLADLLPILRQGTVLGGS
jgi:hypothetical protein